MAVVICVICIKRVNSRTIYIYRSDERNKYQVIGATRTTVQITFIFIDFRVCDFAFAFKTQNAPCVIFRQISICVLNANETFV